MMSKCDFCGSGEVAEVVYDERIASGRRKVAVEGLKKMECPDCGHEYIESAQLLHNHALMEAATTITPGQVSTALLRTIREKWALTQRTASTLFGAGANSFAKWESGQMPSGPTALLLQCAANVPQVVEYLARLQGATLPSCPELADWSDVNGEVTGKMLVHSGFENARSNNVLNLFPMNDEKLSYSLDRVELLKAA